MSDSTSETCKDLDGRPEPERFQSALDKAAAIKKEYVDKQITFYGKGKLTWPRILFRLVGSLVIVCSALLPAFAAATKFTYQYQAVTILSVSVAILSGLAAFYRWDITWKGRIMTRGTLEQLCAKWAVELTRAKECMKPEERIKHVCDATDDLIKNVNAVVSAESGTFFQGVKMPDRVHNPKDD